MNMYLINTKNGNFMAIAETEERAKIEFTIEFPSEKIRKIKGVDDKVFRIDYSGTKEVWDM